MKGLVVTDKFSRIHNYHKNTVKHYLELVAAAGLDGPDALRPDHVFRRVNAEAEKKLSEIYEYIAPGALLANDIPEAFKADWDAADPDGFAPRQV